MSVGAARRADSKPSRGSSAGRVRPPGPGTRRALVCAPLPPEYDRESGSRRVWHAIELLREAGWNVTFVCESAGQGGRHLAHLRQQGVPAWVGFGERTLRMIERADFDVALFAFWHLARDHVATVRKLSPSTRVVVDSIDLHWLRRAREALGGSAGGSGRLEPDHGRELVDEMNAYASADAVLTVSQREADLIDDVLCRPGFARAVPDSDELPASSVPPARRRGILFVGNFRHPPNLDAVQWLCGEVLPRVDARTRARHPVRIVGTGLDGRVQAAAEGCPDVQLVGWVPSLTPYLHAARISVVPLRYGAGTKRKLIQALLAGTPTVSTSVGVEGLDLTPERHVLVADDADAFAAEIERLLDDAALWRRLAASGRNRMLRIRSRKAARESLLAAIADVCARPLAAPAAPPATGPAARNGTREAVGGSEAEAGPTGLPGANGSARPPLDALRRAVASSVPVDASVLVVSKGDPELLAASGARARHFPSDRSGTYAGYHPRDSAQAVGWLEARRDATHLLVPGSAFWWLEHYAEFARHLSERHERVWCDEACLIYRLVRG